ncbi:MAG: 4-(cytidine 5'-diphospho)-2-C-methyl-D-erythritol kinase [Alphaproteobacteria bacterium]|nr:4-(cytidine 5'-diphospho)-2-C-methyl-D-erythritol kinase [Alphaproteobacteria bacterium]
MIHERARAKVNLTLRVLGRRPDGYHEIDSLIAFADDAFDTVTLDPGRPVGVTVSGPFADRIVGDNIVAMTLRRLAETEPRLQLGAVHIEKRLPVAAGIGGGSADAGAVLRAVASANPDHSGRIDWLAIAASLGADVPVCFTNVACRATGLGEILGPLPQLPTLSAVLVNSLDDVPADKTAQVFRLLAAGPLPASPAQAPHAVPADDRALVEMLSQVGNDLEPAARTAFPVIAKVLDALREIEGCRFAAMSGAGPTCFGLFEDCGHAAGALASRHPAWWIAPTRL